MNTNKVQKSQIGNILGIEKAPEYTLDPEKYLIFAALAA